MEGQLSIFDWIPQTEVQQVEQCSTVKCTKASECEAYPIGCGGTIEPCRFGGPYKWNEDIKDMTTERLAELLGKRINVTFTPFQKHYTARKNGYDITIGFMNNWEGKKVISVDAQYKDRKYGGGSSFDDIEDAASYITCWLNRCRYSQHKCNKENLWDIADTLDDIECPRVCCRKCNVRVCGSRCNGSKEPTASVGDMQTQKA